MKRTPLRKMSAKRRKEDAERRRVLHEHFGSAPPCMLCGPLRAFGVETGCDGRATDADEVLRRSAGGSITDVANIRPVGRACHRWATEHPREMREWGLEGSRYGSPCRHCNDEGVVHDMAGNMLGPCDCAASA